jgi:hypothetical protein
LSPLAWTVQNVRIGQGNNQNAAIVEDADTNIDSALAAAMVTLTAGGQSTWPMTAAGLHPGELAPIPAARPFAHSLL